MKYLLDTDTCIGVLRRQTGITEKLALIDPEECAISVVSVYELFCGVEKAQNPARERQKVERFISLITELPFDQEGAQAAAQIRTELEQRGQRIGPYDLLIAGQAVAGGLSLITNNVREFQRVRGLLWESWM